MLSEKYYAVRLFTVILKREKERKMRFSVIVIILLCGISIPMEICAASKFGFDSFKSSDSKSGLPGLDKKSKSSAKTKTTPANDKNGGKDSGNQAAKPAKKGGKDVNVNAPTQSLPEWAAKDKGVHLKTVPGQILLHKRYLFYLVGDAENMGLKNYRAIIKALVAPGFVVISNPIKDSGYNAGYIQGLASEVKLLLDAGVPPKNITVAGYAQGGMTVIRLATLLNDPAMNYVVISGSPRADGAVQFPADAEIDPAGMILNIYDRDDKDFGSLNDYLKDKGIKIRAFCNDRPLKTGKGRAFGFQPMKEWLEPTINWAGKN